MNKKVNLAVALLVTASIGLSLNACKKKGTDPEPAPAKTLNKSLLIGKDWKNKGGTASHPIYANGVYGGAGGPWYWKNNGDTMVVDIDGPGIYFFPMQWKFFWSAEHEMECKRMDPGAIIQLFKDAPW